MHRALVQAPVLGVHMSVWGGMYRFYDKQPLVDGSSQDKQSTSITVLV